MDPAFRPHYNAHAEPLFEEYMRRLRSQVGDFTFRMAETPLFLDTPLRTQLVRDVKEILAQLSQPALIEQLKKAIPARYDVPGMDELPSCVQVDMGLTRLEDGTIEGRLVELQGFPSLYALMSLMGKTWAEVFQSVPSLEGRWRCHIDRSWDEAIGAMRDNLLGGEDPTEVVLVDHEPRSQKTLPDFEATRLLFGIETCGLDELVKEGRRLFRMKGGKKVPVRRIFNRAVFDELEVKNAKVPFDWNEPLDVSWCPHPNWYWAWSKYSMPFLEHRAVPNVRFLSEAMGSLPDDLSNYVLKPLYSFAGSGVVVDLDRAAIDSIPEGERDGWILQEKIDYAPVLRMPDGNGVKVEVRVMCMRVGGGPPEPILFLVRLSRGKMLGVDFNKGLTWVGGTVAVWRDE